jgi:hypothetical protein
VITPCGPIFFPYNSARINNEHKACLDDIAIRLQQDPPRQWSSTVTATQRNVWAYRLHEPTTRVITW